MVYDYNENGEVIRIEDMSLLMEVGEREYDDWQRFNDTRVERGYFPLEYEEFKVNRMANDKLDALEDEHKREQSKKAIEKRRSKDEFKVFIREDYGSFFLCNARNLFRLKVERNYIARFLRLCDRMDYDNKVKLKRDTVAIERDLKGLWGLSPNETTRTKKALIDANLILIEDDKTITINNKYAKKGKVKNRKFLKESARVYTKGMDELYEQLPCRKHHLITLLMELVPYANYHYNVICTKESIEEKDVDKIEPLTIKELCGILGYNETNANKLQRELNSLRIKGQYAFIVVLKGKQRFVYINPRLFYKGDDINTLRGLMKIFDIGNNKQ